MWVCFPDEGVAMIGHVRSVEPGPTFVVETALGFLASVPGSAVTHVLDPESGSILPFHEVVSAGELAANSPARLSGYPHAWRYVRRWREEVAPDWRSIALVGIFAVKSIQQPEKAFERSFREMGPTLRALLQSGIVPGVDELEAMLREARTGLARTKARQFHEILLWAPQLRSRMRRDPTYTREFRDGVALSSTLPKGLSMAKLSFTLSLLGRDGACLDTRVLQLLCAADVKEAARVAKRWQKKRGVLGERQLGRYRSVEDLLKETEFWDAAWPMPFARAQWLAW